MRLAAAVREELERRNLTVNSASERFHMSREALTRLARGNPPSLRTVERWAQALGQDVNRWRELCGYERLDAALPAAARLRENAREVLYELEALEGQAYAGTWTPAEVEAIRLLAEAIRREDRGIAE